jgi:hypothetical protein
MYQLGWGIICGVSEWTTVHIILTDKFAHWEGRQRSQMAQQVYPLHHQAFKYNIMYFGEIIVP